MAKKDKDSRALPGGITQEYLTQCWDGATNEYLPAFQRCAILDGTDKNRMWDAIGAKFPDYMILTNTNHVSYIKYNILANIYVVGRQATLQPTSEGDKDKVMQLNIALERLWSIGRVPYYQMLAGERAALLNRGVTHVSWDSTKKGNEGDKFYKGEPVLRNVDPMKFMRDPFSQDLDDAMYSIEWDYKHINQLKREYGEVMDEFDENHHGPTSSQIHKFTDKLNDRPTGKGYHKVIYFSIYDPDDMNNLYEIDTIEGTFILEVRKLRIPAISYSELYCNIPESDDVIGIPETARIFANSVADNLVKSLALTAEYKNQRPPRYVNANSGMDIAAFQKYGNDADQTYIVSGDASKAVHYHQFPQVSPQALQIIQGLGIDIEKMTGIDGRYTGRDTGSILTTGGMESMLDQVSMVDQPKIANYEHYSKRLSQLIIMNMIEFGQERNYFHKNKQTNKTETITVNFGEIDKNTVFDYELSIDAVLPKTKQRIAQMANMLMEKQMQYNAQGGMRVELLTPEEWLMMIDIPIKEYMMERMKIQRSQDWIEKTTATIVTYGKLVEAGMNPDEALLETAAHVEKQSRPTPENADFVGMGSPLQGQGI